MRTPYSRDLDLPRISPCSIADHFSQWPQPSRARQRSRFNDEAAALLQPSATLPPSIAALTVDARPGPADYERRAPRAHREGQAADDARRRSTRWCFSGGTSLVYFTNIRWGGGERLFACVIPVEGRAVFRAVRRSKRIAHASRSRSGRSPTVVADVRTWNEDESPYALVAQGLKDRGLSTGTIGVEETMKFVWSDGIAAAAPQLKVVSGTPITAGCRMIKDAHELELMRVASDATLKVYEAVYRALQPGMTQNQVSDLIDAGLPAGRLPRRARACRSASTRRSPTARSRRRPFAKARSS